MCDNMKNNPFAGLFSSIDDAVSLSSENQMSINENNGVDCITRLEDKDSHDITECTNFRDSEEFKIDSKVNHILGDIFGITLYATETSNQQKQRLVFVDVDSIGEAVFDRLMLPDLESSLVPEKNSQEICCDSHTLDKQAIFYLFESYCRLQRYQNNLELSDVLSDIRQVILQNAALALQEPDLFREQEVRYMRMLLFQLCKTNRKRPRRISQNVI